MKREELKEGGLYVVKISTGLTVVRLDKIEVWTDSTFKSPMMNRIHRGRTRYYATNLRTNREVVLKSSTKFRREASSIEIDKAKNGAAQQHKLNALRDKAITTGGLTDQDFKDVLGEGSDTSCNGTNPDDQARLSKDPADAIVSDVWDKLKESYMKTRFYVRQEREAQLRKELADIVRSHLQGMEIERMASN